MPCALAFREAPTEDGCCDVDVIDNLEVHHAHADVVGAVFEGERQGLFWRDGSRGRRLEGDPRLVALFEPGGERFGISAPAVVIPAAAVRKKEAAPAATLEARAPVRNSRRLAFMV